jgi:tetratricopeptide (TPR) repeat protein
MKRRITMLTLIFSLILAFAGADAKELAAKGYSTFQAVLAGDEAKLPEAIRLMEQSRDADANNVNNLYNLARAYLFEGITFDKNESFMKSEKAFARVVELDPNHVDALAFHGGMLILGSGGGDQAMLMRGIQDMKTALQRNPNDIGVRIIIGMMTASLPPQFHAALGLGNPVENLKLIGGKLDNLNSDFAPHAAVVMNAVIGEALMSAGQKEKARVSFEKALKVPQPYDDGQIAGRKVLDGIIAARMNGGEKPIFAERVFSGCHSCHLSAPDKLLKR